MPTPGIAGYWGPHVGFYGGINYGYGYGGYRLQGGYWNNGAFNYNRSVNNVNVTNIHNVYNKTVINNTTVNNVSYNGGAGGITARPTQQEETAAREQHRPPTAQQTQHVNAASTNHALLASVNHGRPAIAATAKPAEFTGMGVVAARQAGAPYKAAESHAAAPSAASKAVPCDMRRAPPPGDGAWPLPQRALISCLLRPLSQISRLRPVRRLPPRRSPLLIRRLQFVPSPLRAPRPHLGLRPARRALLVR